ncbi:MAG: ATP-binding cassette domain-containing protein [Syntrophothermus sp.]|uniref:ATP-binding cassette domain-containing protein n=1 Tax=Syntrophothermus sp. TaxID=2736299 RepID=UPI0025810838|nr:ATP-binding cassette domain-containing protein [Syntrophothermus sp.]NSW83878.1 ATP-binding cassette domain-containing protein [Syntrophothermus sp.]
MIIATEKLTRKYGRLVAVDSVDLGVYEGEIFGFLGPNGAGKTTTIHMLCTLLKPSGGEAWVAGYNVEHEQTLVRRNIGLVFQEPTLDENLTATENLVFHGMIYGLTGRYLEERIKEVMKLALLWERRNDLVKTFSGGMKRRLEIARGLVHLPKVLFLDEPTLGLDPQTRKHIWDYIRRTREETGTTVFMTTHYMDEAENCDRIAIIDHGRIIACDTPDNLKQMVKGDVVEVTSSKVHQLAAFLEERFEVKPEFIQDGLKFEVQRADELLPVLLQQAGTGLIEKVNFAKPTLDDVFLRLTGKSMRDEDADPRGEFRRRIGMRLRKG